MNPTYTKRRELYRFGAIAVVLCFAATYLGLIFGYPQQFTPEKNHRTFSQIARDGWIEDGATINLPRLLKRGNRIDLDLTSWRPGDLDPARLIFSLCGKEISRIIVDKDMKHRLFLTGDCEPRTIQVQVENPFVPSARDTRQAGAQLTGVSLSSKLGPPLVVVELALLITLFVTLLAFSGGLLFAGRMRFGVTALLAGISGILLGSVQLSSLFQLIAPWSALMLVIIGAHMKGGERAPATQTEDSQCGSLYGRLFLLFVVVAGGYLRFGPLDFGLPMNFHPDEVPKTYAIMRMYSTGTLNPQYFLHPTLLLYCTYGMNLLLHSLGAATGEFQDSLVFAGRLVSATAGTASIVLVFLIGRTLVSARVGVFAAALLAFFPLHVTCSRYLKEDSLLTFFILFSALFAAYAIKHKNARWLVLAGLAAGCSASVKYSGILTVGIPCLAALMLEGRFPREKRTYVYLFIGLALVPLAFVVCSPYVILDSPKFLEDFGYEQRHMSKGHSFAITPWSQYWSYHFSRSLVPGMTEVPLILSMLAMGFLVFRKDGAGIFFILLALAFYFPAEYVKAKPAPQPERYILPCLPFLALMIATALERYVATFDAGRAKRLFLMIAAISLIPPAVRSTQYFSEVSSDTRIQMMAWMEENLPEGAKVYVDHKRYSPELSEERFALTYAPRANIHRDLHPKILREQEQEYLLLSSLWYDRYFSQPKTDTAVRRKIQLLFKELEIEKDFAPQFGTYGFHNPRVTLFRLKELMAEVTISQK